MTIQILPSAIERLNSSCFCMTLDREALYAAMELEARDPEFSARHIRPREHLFSNVPLFQSVRELESMRAVIEMVEAAARLPAYRQAVLGWAPQIAGFDPGPRGALMGYDFHLGANGPKLIEVNTNAGGAFLNALLAKAQHACCAEVRRAFELPFLADFNSELIAMFRQEWATQRNGRTLKKVAIVDDNPESQYLYPEFLLARETFRRHDIDAVIIDARELRYDGAALRAGDVPVDLVYNRLVDFALERPEHAALRDAYIAGAVVVTPNPRNHALLADKRNLTVLSNAAKLLELGLPASVAAHSARIPHTVRVTQANAAILWEARKGYFFKPATGHGAKAVYRGDKITRSVWQQVLASDYVAQELAPPGQRMVEFDHAREPRKADVRLFTYDGRILLAAARLYQGQTTNFRTPGGGFAPVFFLDVDTLGSRELADAPACG